MGADLRGFVEYKLDNHWYVFAGDINFPRNYRLLACLRPWGFGYKCPKLKEWPDDISHGVLLKHKENKAAPGTWLTLAEINQAHYEYMSHGYDTVPVMSVLSVMMEELSKNFECRFVFWVNI